MKKKEKRSSYNKSFFKFIYLFILREEKHMSSGEGAERGRERIQSKLRAVSMEPHLVLNPMKLKIMTRAKD